MKSLNAVKLYDYDYYDKMTRRPPSGQKDIGRIQLHQLLVILESECGRGHSVMPASH